MAIGIFGSSNKSRQSSDQYGYNVSTGSQGSSSRSKNNAKWLTDAWEGLYGDASNQANNLYGNQDWASGANLLQNSVGAGSLGLGNVQNAMGTAGNVANFTPGMFTGVDMQQYMNPYQQQVIDAAMGDMNRQRQMMLQGVGDQAQAAGAFGGSRHGVAEAETNRGAMDAMSRTIAGLRQQGYDQASGLAMQDIQNQMAGQGLNLQAAGMMGDLGNMYQQMGLQGGEALQNLGLAPLNLRLGVLAGTPGGLGGTSSSSSWGSNTSMGENFGTSTGRSSGFSLGIGK